MINDERQDKDEVGREGRMMFLSSAPKVWGRGEFG